MTMAQFDMSECGARLKKRNHMLRSYEFSILNSWSVNRLLASVNWRWLLTFQLKPRDRKKLKQYRAIFQLEMQVAFWLLGLRNELRHSLLHNSNLRAHNFGNCRLLYEVDLTYPHLCNRSHQIASQAQTLRSGDELWTLALSCLYFFVLVQLFPHLCHLITKSLYDCVQKVVSPLRWFCVLYRPCYDAFQYIFRLTKALTSKLWCFLRTCITQATKLFIPWLSLFSCLPSRERSSKPIVFNFSPAYEYWNVIILWCRNNLPGGAECYLTS